MGLQSLLARRNWLSESAGNPRSSTGGSIEANSICVFYVGGFWDYGVVTTLPPARSYLRLMEFLLYTHLLDTASSFHSLGR